MAQMIVLNSTPAQREQLIMELYKSAFPLVAGYVSKMGGSFDDAKDVFQDALVAYYEKVVSGDIDIKTSEKAYLFGIAKNLWLKKFRGDCNNLPLDNFAEGFDLADDAEQHPSSTKILHYLQTAGKKCMELLSAFYYHKMPMKEVAGLFGYAGEHSVTVQKYKCLEKVRETVKQQSLTYADFVE